MRSTFTLLMVSAIVCLGSVGNAKQAAHSTSKFPYLSRKSEKFFVDGSAIPEVKFNVGESYAGLLPIPCSANSSLFFWFFPSKNPSATDEITIWLNGGPGDSSMKGLLQGNGPFLWKEGALAPVRNPYSWNKLTNMVYIDQPVGTGFSPSVGSVKDVTDIAEQITCWFKNFVQTFGLQGRKVYITGESYAGHMIPYIASRMLDTNDRTHFNVKGINIINSVINDYSILQQAPAVAALNYHRKEFRLNESFIASSNARAEKCGYTKFLSKALTYPPPKQFPAVPDPEQNDCRIWSDILTASFAVNPCFTPYNLKHRCPTLSNVMDDGPGSYFNRSDVQKLLNVPPTNYKVGGGFMWSGFPGKDALGPRPSAQGPLPSVIERTNNTLISNGLLDYLLLANGSLATIQNMTWNGQKGFQTRPVEPLLVPSQEWQSNPWKKRESTEKAIHGGMSVKGTALTERGLTFITVFEAGHEMSRDAPAASYHQLQFLLGRIHSLSK
ncbi:uncharacterized protein UV8b_03313 [Ustilaginoidea virens]|uniref:Carboxypeptidase n=1 Tax=Ustilaginoidea virens TaxID=1159556 RepID=A0A8E5MGZ8_USTVR|nr:uncharacterized protein UV8b_03313 [Ustilaginoidea virens]QUC19072.1 hypothetical protein UV8b_03313 [Ustilaginoidea virens]